MNKLTYTLIAALWMAVPSFAQVEPVSPVAPAEPLSALAQVDADEAMTRAQAAIEKAQTTLTDLRMPDLNFNLQALKSNMGLDFQNALTLQSKMRMDRGNSSYDRGTSLLDGHRYEEAVQAFDTVINEKSARADGALYWKAYAQNRIGRRDDALATLAALRRDYPASHWLSDAQALEADVKQGSGQGASSAQESNEDIKLMAINSLMNADPERATPLLEGLLKGSGSPRVKDRALFVLTQSRSPRAQQLLTEYAKGAGNPDLQIRAVRYLGISGAADAQQQLVSVYGGSPDVAVKREIIRALMTSRGRDPLFNIAKSEKDDNLRGEAISQLGNMRATDQLTQLYASETSVDNKVQIIRSLSNGGASDKLLELVRNEKEPRVRSEAIRSFAMSRSTPPEAIAGLYAAETDPKVKKEIVSGLHARGEGKLMVDLARKENDPVMKRYIVERLSTMHSKEATDYMIELLK